MFSVVQNYKINEQGLCRKHALVLTRSDCSQVAFHRLHASGRFDEHGTTQFSGVTRVRSSFESLGFVQRTPSNPSSGQKQAPSTQHSKLLKLSQSDFFSRSLSSTSTQCYLHSYLNMFIALFWLFVLMSTRADPICNASALVDARRPQVQRAARASAPFCASRRRQRQLRPAAAAASRVPRAVQLHSHTPKLLFQETIIQNLFLLMKQELHSSNKIQIAVFMPLNG